MQSPCNEIKYDHIQNLISAFCKIILTQSDTLYKKDVEVFIDSLSNEDICDLNFENAYADTQIRTIVLNEIVEYIKKFDFHSQSEYFKKPFEFDSAGEYESFYSYCKEYYQRKNQNNKLPPVLDFTLQYIREMSDHYRIFGYFYDYRSMVTKNEIVEDLKQTASSLIKEEVESQIGSITQEVAEKKVDYAVDKKMIEVSKTVSETSVTILGIFAGIVLTVVAGLFYSSSVLDNINTASFFKLLCVASLIGVVCFDLIVVMFLFIDRFREKTDKSIEKSKQLHTFLLLVNIVLILTFVVTGILQIFFPGQEQTSGTNDTGVNESTQIDMPSTDSTESSDSDEQKDNNTTVEGDSQT